ncbi:hypothetical protein [Petroclostridium sp. X23]|uniref:hypothetical protein n=1 Tax=Petroclostridium sp. X23 TaxID=3045146 RepID=UPI0024AD4D0B|nr:hypothetical protein [Petroclostridium sp. X23]WHH57184.1 hypothetical protein QKW49_15205 [Petroclostridium sp. X23]
MTCCSYSFGRYSDELLTIDVTLMNPAEYPSPLSKYAVFDVRLRCKDVKKQIDLNNLTFYLLCNGKIYNSVDPFVNMELKQYIEASNAHTLFFGNPYVGYCESQLLTILFEPIHEVYYKPSTLVFHYKEYKFLPMISLTC